MSVFVGFQLALELSNVFPVKETVSWMIAGASAQILDFARDLRKSGSDIVVEEDLAAIFGRGRVSFELEKKFKEAVKIRSITPLSKGSEISLVSGPGPTLVRAFGDRHYFGTVVTLSMLGYYHGRDELASMLSEAMTKRFEMGIQGASSNPGYEGIVGTLAACSAQTSPFAWSYYSELVEQKLKSFLPKYHYSSLYARMSPSTLLGAMDYLYLVQSLPEDRKMTVSTEMGCITLIIWAHYILDLSVTITDTQSGDSILFGNSKEPNVYISWMHKDSDMLKDPTVRLHEQNITIILSESEPDPKERRLNRTQERHPLRGYATTYLRRALNYNVIIPEDEMVYVDFVQIVTAAVINASRRLDRRSNHSASPITSNGESGPGLNRPWTHLQTWRIMASARIIFHGLRVDPTEIERHMDFLAQNKLMETNLPASFHAFLAKSLRISGDDGFARLWDALTGLSSILLLFSHVREVESCADMPLIIWDHFRDHFWVLGFNVIFRDPNERVIIGSHDLFDCLGGLLDSSDKTISTKDSYLCSDFGWSVFMSTALEEDPGATVPELIFVKRGTPTNTRTNEQRFRLIDGVTFHWQYPSALDKLERGPDYLPRAVATVSKRSEYCVTRSQHFEVTQVYTVAPNPEWKKECASSKFDRSISFRAMHNTLWETWSTNSCEHDLAVQPTLTPIALGPDAATFLGWHMQNPKRVTEHTIVFLTRGEPYIRWLALVDNVKKEHTSSSYNLRDVMLRTESCCDSCAMAQVSTRPGKWILIL